LLACPTLAWKRNTIGCGTSASRARESWTAEIPSRADVPGATTVWLPVTPATGEWWKQNKCNFFVRKDYVQISLNFFSVKSGWGGHDFFNLKSTSNF
jgi:hypothetical protein